MAGRWRDRDNEHDEHEQDEHVVERIYRLLSEQMDQQLDQMLQTIKIHLYEGFLITMAAIDDLTAAVANDTTVDQSAITLLQGLKAALDSAIASGDPAALQALSDQLGQNQTALAQAIVDNTPAATA